MKRFILFLMTGVLLPFGAFAGDYQNYYRDRGTTLPRAVSSDPMGSPYSTGVMMGGTALGSTVNIPRQARRDHDERVQAELDEREKRAQAWREPPLKFNIPAPEMPKPGAVN